MAEEVSIEGGLSRDDLDAVEIPPGFHSIVRGAELRPVLRRVIEAGGAVAAARYRKTLIGYATELPFVPVVWPGGSIERRWERLSGARELGSLEVLAPFRSRGIAKRLVAALTAGGRLDPYIVIGEALSWHWDLIGAGLGLWAYRGLLLRILASAGFHRFGTDELEVSASGVNFLAARIGPGTSEADRRAFREALYR